MKIINNKNRKNLGEGRNYGIGFSFLNKKTKTVFETETPFTACRDFLNDFVYVESTKKKLNPVYGFKQEYSKYFDKKRLFYLGVNTLDFLPFAKWKEKETCLKILSSNYEKLEKLINFIESEIGLKNKTKIYLSKSKEELIFKVPIIWGKNGPLISFYTLLIRCYFNINDVEDLTTEKLKNILNNNNCFIPEDNYMKQLVSKGFSKIMDSFEKIKNFQHEGDFQQSPYKIHNYGIQKYVRNN